MSTGIAGGAAVSDRLEICAVRKAAFGQPAAVKASQPLTLDTNPTDGDTMTIGTRVYTFKTVPAAIDDITLDGTLAVTKTNLVAAINGTGTDGVEAFTGTTKNLQVIFDNFVNDLTTVRAVSQGTSFNSVATVETFTAVTNVFGGAVLTGGTDAPYSALRVTSESLTHNTDSVNSDEIRSDRQNVDVIRTNIGTSGDIGTELSYGAHDDLMEAALLSEPFTTGHSTISAATTIFFDASDNSVNDSGSGFLPGGGGDYTVGSWIRSSGNTIAANNNCFRIVSVTAAKMVLAGGVVSNSVAGDAVTLKQGEEIVNNVCEYVYDIEKKMTDIDCYAHFVDQVVNGMSITVAAEALIVGTFSFTGRNEESNDFTQASSVTASAQNPVLNAIDNVKAVFENDTATDVSNVSFTLGNGVRQRSNVSTLGAASFGFGKIDLTGTLQAFLKDKVLMDKYLNFERSSLSISLEDALGNNYIFEFPAVKFTSGARVAGGINQDIIADMAFTAYRHDVRNFTIKIVRIAA